MHDGDPTTPQLPKVHLPESPQDWDRGSQGGSHASSASQTQPCFAKHFTSGRFLPLVGGNKGSWQHMTMAATPGAGLESFGLKLLLIMLYAWLTLFMVWDTRGASTWGAR